MSIVRYFSAISLAGALTGLFYGCSAATGAPSDAGKDSRGNVGDSAKAEGGAADKCDPDIAGFAPITIKRPRKLPACSKDQIKAFVDAGFNANSTISFPSWQAEEANKACAACILTDVAQPEWGAFLFDGENSRGFNLAGCLELRGAASGCPQATDEAFACLDAACADCKALIPKGATSSDPTMTAYEACRDKAHKGDGACGKYTASETINKCAVNMGVDGGPILRADGGEDFVKAWEECVAGMPEETDKNPSAEADFFQYAERFVGIFCAMN